MIEGSCNFMSKSSSFHVTIQPSLVAIGTLVMRICFKFVTWSCKTTWSKGHVVLSVGTPHGKSPPCKFDSHKNCCRGDLFLVNERQDSSCPHLNPPSLFISKAHGMPFSCTKFQDVDTIIWQFGQKRTSSPGHTCLQQQLTETTWKTFASPSRNSDEQEKEKKKREVGDSLSVSILSLQVA